MKALKLAVAVFTAVKSIWTRGSPFAAFSALWPANHEGKLLHNWELGSRIGKIKSALLPKLKVEKNGGLNTTKRFLGSRELPRVPD
jgi:hypothetical protein